MKDKKQLLLVFMLLVLPNIVFANAMVSAPIIWQGLFMGTNSIFRYIAATTLICVGVEAAIYRYLPQFDHPYRDSLIANALSALLGFPAGMASAILGEPFIVATVITIVSECWLICVLEKSRTKDKSIFVPVLLANILSNAMIITLIILKTET